MIRFGVIILLNSIQTWTNDMQSFVFTYSTFSVPMSLITVENILSDITQKNSKESECRNYSTCWLTLLSVLFIKLHKENAGHSKYISKLFSQKVTEQIVPCPKAAATSPVNPANSCGEWNRVTPLQVTIVHFCKQLGNGK